MKHFRQIKYCGCLGNHSRVNLVKWIRVGDSNLYEAFEKRLILGMLCSTVVAMGSSAFIPNYNWYNTAVFKEKPYLGDTFHFFQPLTRRPGTETLVISSEVWVRKSDAPGTWKPGEYPYYPEQDSIN